MNTYFVVCQFSHVRKDWFINGMYSKREDADAHLASLQHGKGVAATAVVEWSHDDLVHKLIEERLRPVAALAGVKPHEFA